ncbi:MAG: redox-sensing transcriptional repressor Rex [Anaerolineales bacterium]|nr:redox-sensing transcriptional repressor Rex [Anaerolineales bacterium]
MTTEKIPDIIIGRLPIYLRALQRLADAGALTTSSRELGELVGISAAQIRKDISQFGEFGKQGTGYSISFLMDKLRDILKVDRVWEIAIVGMGGIGQALAHFNGFADRGFRVGMTFDNDPKKIGRKAADFVVLDAATIEDEISARGIKIALLCVPAASAQEAADRLARAGVKAILNYAPASISVPEDVRVQYIDPVAHLQRMTYYL